MLRLIKFYVLMILAGVLTGCMVGPNFHSPAAPCTSKYTPKCQPTHTVSSPGPGGQKQFLAAGQDIPAQWWFLFQSEPLNQLICQGLANSPTLAAGQAALHQAQENLKAGIGALFPSIDAVGSYERQRFSATSFGDTPSGTEGPRADIFNLFNAGLNISYTLDVFGGTRRQIESLHALSEAQCFELEATYLTLTSNIVTAAVTDASLRAQIAATKDLIKTSADQLAIVQKQFKLGGASRADILTQQTQLAQLQTTLPPLIKNLEQNEDALAVLVGVLPSESCLPSFNLDDLHLPTCLPLSIPSLLVRQRPDVRAAEAQLHSASALIGVATANLLPQFTLNGFYGSQANKISDLFKSNASVWNYTAQVLQPVFRGGTLLAQRRASIAAYCQAYAQYRETVLQAFQNVSDALIAIQIDAQALQAQTNALIAAQKTLTLTRKQFKLGAVSYLTLLNAQRQYDQLRITKIQTQAARYTDTAALFQALGGGWWNRCPQPIPPVTLKKDC